MCLHKKEREKYMCQRKVNIVIVVDRTYLPPSIIEKKNQWRPELILTTQSNSFSKKYIYCQTKFHGQNSVSL